MPKARESAHSIDARFVVAFGHATGIVICMPIKARGSAHPFDARFCIKGYIFEARR